MTRWHSGTGLGPLAFAPPNGGQGSGPKLPACFACRGCGSFCSFESTGSAGDTDRWGSRFYNLSITVGEGCEWCRLFVSTEAKFTSFWNVILDEKKPLFTTEKFLSQASEESMEISFLYVSIAEDHEWCEMSRLKMMDSFCLCPCCVALLTALLLCERLFLDHANRLNSSKSTWVCTLINLHITFSQQMSQSIAGKWNISFILCDGNLDIQKDGNTKVIYVYLIWAFCRKDQHRESQGTQSEDGE